MSRSARGRPRACARERPAVSHPACGDRSCRRRASRAGRPRSGRAALLLATSLGHVLPSISRVAGAMGLRIGTAPGLLDIVDDEGGRRIDRLFQRLARELTAAETEAVRVVTDPPARRRRAGHPAAHRAHPRGRARPPRASPWRWRCWPRPSSGRCTSRSCRWPPAGWSATRRCCAAGSTAARSAGATCSSSPSGPAGCTGWTGSRRESAITGAAGWLGGDDLFVNFNPAADLPAVRSAWPAPSAWCTTAASTRRQLVFEVVESHAVTDRGAPAVGAGAPPVAGLADRPGRRRTSAGRAWRWWPSSGPTCSSSSKTLVARLHEPGPQRDRPGAHRAHPRAGRPGRRRGDRDRADGRRRRRRVGADLGQGWLFGRPVRPEPESEPELVLA